MIFRQIGPGEIVIIAGLVLLLFGPRRLPELARSVGRSLTEFRRGVRQAEVEKDASANDSEPTEHAARD